MVSRGHRRRLRPARLLLMLPVALWALLAAAPVLVTILSSFKDNASLIADPLGWPSSLHFDNYASAAAGVRGGQPITIYLLNSLIATSTGLVLGTAAAILAAHYLARGQSRAVGWGNRYFFLLLTLPPVVGLIPLFTITGTLGLRDSPWGLGIVYAAMSIPLSVVLLRSFFAGFPPEILEAARVDGASELRTLLTIVLPLSRGPIATVMLLQGIGIWNELTLAIVLLTRSGTYTVPIGLLLFHAQYGVDLGAQFAGLMIAAVPILIAYALTQRQLIEGLRAGAIR